MIKVVSVGRSCSRRLILQKCILANYTDERNHLFDSSDEGRRDGPPGMKDGVEQISEAR